MNKINTSSLKQLVKAAGITAIYGAIGYILTFIFNVAVARYFGPEDYGVYSLGITILGLGVMIAGLGILVGIPRFIPLYIHEKKYNLLQGYVHFIFVTIFVSSITVGFVLWVSASYITSFFDFPESLTFFLKIIAVLVPIKMIKATMRQIFLAEKKIVYQQFTYNVIEKLVLVIGIIFILWKSSSLEMLMIVTGLSITIPFFIDTWLYKKKIHLPQSVEREYEIKNWFYFSLPLLLTGVFSFFISWTDNLAIGKFMSAADLGVYAIAYSFAISLDFFQKAFSAIFVPIITEKYAKKQHEEITFLFKKTAAWGFGLTFPVFLVMAVYGKQVLSLIYGNAYELGYLPLMIIASGSLINVITGLNYPILMLHKKTGFIFVVEAGIVILNIALNFLLIPIIGIVGAAIASGVSLALQNVIFLKIAMRY